MISTTWFSLVLYNVLTGVVWGSGSLSRPQKLEKFLYITPFKDVPHRFWACVCLGYICVNSRVLKLTDGTKIYCRICTEDCMLQVDFSTCKLCVQRKLLASCSWIQTGKAHFRYVITSDKEMFSETTFTCLDLYLTLHDLRVLPCVASQESHWADGLVHGIAHLCLS